MDQDFEELVLAHNPDAVVTVDAAGRVLHWSAAAERLFGHAVAEAQRHTFDELIVPPEQAGEIAAGLQRALAGGSGADETVRCHKDGSRMHVSSAVSVVPDANGLAPTLLLTLRVVTALKVGRETRLVEARWRELRESTPDAILIVNVTGRIVLANHQAQQVFGHAPGELIGQPVEALLPPRYRHQHVARRSAFYEQPRRRSMGAGLELFGQRKGGEEFPVEISLGPLQTEEGPMVMCAVRDITDRQEARRKSDRQFRDLLESAPDAMVIVDEAGRIVRVNSQTVHLFGHPREAMLGQPVEMLVPERFRDRGVCVNTAESGTGTAAPKRVLVVDDNPLNRKLACDLLELEGYMVEACETAVQAQTLLAEGSPPDLVLMDIALPDMDGLALTRRLKAEARFAAMPIVAMTAFAMKGDEAKALAAGCAGYISKPIDTRRFPAQVAEVLAVVQPRQPLRIMVVEDHHIDLNLPGIDGPSFLRLLRESPRTRDLPVVAVTAYPDAYQRQTLLEAGCAAYLSKPVNMQALLHELEVASRAAR